jgi:uncharacterized protein YwgA
LEQEPYHWPVGRTTFQKIAYIATQEGLPTGLRYQKSSFGPFSPELKGVITRLVNNGLIQEEQLGRMFAVKVGPTFSDARKAYMNELAQWEPIIEKTTDLFMRMQTRQSEVVATVLFAANTLVNRNKEQPSEKEVLNEVMEWKQRRRPKLDNKEVASTIRNLAALSWLKVKPSSDLPIPDENIAEAEFNNDYEVLSEGCRVQLGTKPGLCILRKVKVGGRELNQCHIFGLTEQSLIIKGGNISTSSLLQI